MEQLHQKSATGDIWKRGTLGSSPIYTTNTDQFADALDAKFGIFNVSSASRSFHGSLDTRESGDKVAGDIACSAARVSRIRHSANATVANHAFKFVWQVDGFSEMKQSEQILKLEPGQFALYRLSSPYQLQTSETYHATTLTCDLSDLPQWQQLAERYSGRALKTDSASRAALAAIRSLFLMPTDESTGYVLSSALQLVFEFLLGLTRTGEYAVPMPSECLERARNAAAGRLSDPDFSPDGLARVLKISRRSLYAEFQRYGVAPPATFIRDLRLARCRADLLDTSLNHCSVTEIAFNNGFSDSAYFSRAFKESYGVAPSRLRKKAVVTRDGLKRVS